MNRRTKGILCIIASAFCFSLMNMFVRLAGDLPTPQKAFFRNAVALLFAIVILVKSGEGFHIGKGNFKYLFLRSFAGTVGIFGNFYAVDHLAQSDASMLNKMSPFCVIVFSYFILKEKLTHWQVLAVVTDCDSEGNATLSLRNKFAAGDEVELMGPDTAATAFTAPMMEDAEGGPLSEPRHPQMVFRMKLPRPAPPLSIIRACRENS